MLRCVLPIYRYLRFSDLIWDTTAARPAVWENDDPMDRHFTMGRALANLSMGQTSSMTGSPCHWGQQADRETVASQGMRR